MRKASKSEFCSTLALTGMEKSRKDQETEGVPRGLEENQESIIVWEVSEDNIVRRKL